MKERDLIFTFAGGCVSIVDRNEEVNNDWRTIGRITKDRAIIVYTTDMTEENWDTIMEYASKANPCISSTQDARIFSEPSKTYPIVIVRSENGKSDLPDVSEVINEFKTNLYAFLEDHDHLHMRGWFFECDVISNIPHETVISLTMSNPGQLIGKGGQYINELQNFLCRMMDKKKFTIYIRECDFWRR